MSHVFDLHFKCRASRAGCLNHLSEQGKEVTQWEEKVRCSYGPIEMLRQLCKAVAGRVPSKQQVLTLLKG